MSGGLTCPNKDLNLKEMIHSIERLYSFQVRCVNLNPTRIFAGLEKLTRDQFVFYANRV